MISRVLQALLGLLALILGLAVFAVIVWLIMAVGFLIGGSIWTFF
jgi:hypothetical protein